MSQFCNKIVSRKRKCTFNDAIKSTFPYLREIPGKDTSVLCSVCNSVFSISSGGRTSVAEHEQTVKHKNALFSRASSSTVTDFF